MPEGLIFDIQRFAVHDGPGIRTNVFFKGCPLRCAWCCNPESQKGCIETGYHEKDCIHCNKCLAVCPSGAITVTMDNNGKSFDTEKCAGCHDKPCTEVCSPGAITLFGKSMSVQQVMDEVSKDEAFYANSQGGVTASGGEPLAQADFLREFFSECRKRGFHTAVETSAFCSWESFEKILDYTDLFLCDIKHMDKERFHAMTKGNLETVTGNLKKLSANGRQIIARIPVIPGYNDDPSSFDAICGFAGEIGAVEIHLLPYHSLGKTKYDKLSIPYGMENLRPPGQEGLENLQKTALEHGLKVRIGG